MRLLECSDNGQFSLTKDFSNDVPSYAILSHNWGDESEEVSFEDMKHFSGEAKVGYRKIQFCGEQAVRDGLKYFWVDTCCVDKSNPVEHQTAINSMFRWYKNSTKCYVYLSDVQISRETVKESSDFRLAFHAARWFTRGWTLQELLAPSSVEFFSVDFRRLGDKLSLERLICERTEIPAEAVRGYEAQKFSTQERVLWVAKRKTKYEEDMAYSLLGMFGIFLPLIYGEGKENAFRRLYEEVERSSKGRDLKEFSLSFNLSGAPETEHFVAREIELSEIHRTLNSGGNRQTVILHGLGGIGKTQLSVAYAKSCKDSYSAILWLNAKDEGSLKQSFVKIAERILKQYPSSSRLSSVGMKDNLDEMVDAVKDWLSLPKNTRWLAIYDNYDNPKVPDNPDLAALDIRKFLPESYQGSIIITTRSSQVAIGHEIQIRKLENEKDSLEILLRTSKRESLVNGKSLKSTSSSLNRRTDPDAMKLARKLEGLPLALATAGAYLKQVTTSFSEYLRLYEKSWLKLMKTSPKLISYEDRMLYSTWQLSVDHVQQRNQISAKLLQFWAYFDNQDIWFELLRHSDSGDPEWIQELTEDEMNFNSAIRVLCDYGLVQADQSSQELFESKGYSMHSCVHSWTIHVLNQRWDQCLANLALKLVALHIPPELAHMWWVTERRLLQHAARCSQMISSGMVADDGMEWAFDALGNLYTDQGNPEEAEKMYIRALQGYQEALGPKDISTLRAICCLACIQMSRGELRQAEKMYLSLLEGCKETLGPKGYLTLQVTCNLGEVYRLQHRIEEAEEIYAQLLPEFEDLYGPKHESTLLATYRLGKLYSDQGKFGDAERRYMQALEVCNETFGRMHISTFLIHRDLGLLYHNHGKLNDAEEMYIQALEGTEEALGLKHPITLAVVTKLGILYQDRCYNLFKRSNLKIILFNLGPLNDSDPLQDIIKLASLCTRYKISRSALLRQLSRVFCWKDEKLLSEFAYSYGYSNMLPQCNISYTCHGCGLEFTNSTGLFMCKSCREVDLCKICFTKYELDELKDTMAGCQDHPFLNLSTECLPTVSDISDEWLQELVSELESRRIS